MQRTIKSIVSKSTYCLGNTFIEHFLFNVHLQSLRKDHEWIYKLVPSQLCSILNSLKKTGKTAIMQKSIFNALQVFLLCILFMACTSSKKSTLTEKNVSRKEPIVLINNYTYLLLQPADNPKYGYDPAYSIDVGGANKSMGPDNQRRFLNALLGPNGETVKYHRAGSCCAFKTPNGFDGVGLMDRYRIYWDGSKDTLTLYINMYDEGDLFIPAGLKARKLY